MNHPEQEDFLGEFKVHILHQAIIVRLIVWHPWAVTWHALLLNEVLAKPFKTQLASLVRDDGADRAFHEIPLRAFVDKFGQFTVSVAVDLFGWDDKIEPFPARVGCPFRMIAIKLIEGCEEVQRWHSARSAKSLLLSSQEMSEV